MRLRLIVTVIAIVVLSAVSVSDALLGAAIEPTQRVGVVLTALVSSGMAGEGSSRPRTARGLITAFA